MSTRVCGRFAAARCPRRPRAGRRTRRRADAGLAVDGRRLSDKAHNPSTSGLDTDTLNRSANSRYRLAEITAGLAGVAALTGGWLLYGRRAAVYPAGAFDANSGTVGLAGGF